MKKNKHFPHKRGGASRGTAALAIALAALFVLASASPLAAHAPDQIQLTYDAAKRLLTVQITHDSGTPDKHYVKKVEIKKNGKTITTADYTKQTGKETFSYTYPLEAGSGDVIEVTATCNMIGSKTEKLDMRKTLR